MTVLVQSTTPGDTRAFRFYRRRALNVAVLLAGDLLALKLALLLAAVVKGALLHRFVGPEWDWVVLLLWPLGAAAARLTPGWGLGAPEEMRRLTQLLLIVLLTRSLTYALTEAGSLNAALALLVNFAIAWPLILLARSFGKTLLIRIGQWGLPTVIYGGGATGAQVVRALQDNPGFGYVPVGVFDDDPSLQGQTVAGVPVLGRTHDTTLAAPMAILAMPGAPRTQMQALLDDNLRVYRQVVIIPDLFGVQSLWVRTRDLAGTLGLELTNTLLGSGAVALKRVFDVLVTLLTLPLWLPLCLLIAGLIWLEDRANPFFVQERVGRGGRMFRTWKFRTMLPNAEEVLQRKLAEDAAMRSEWEAGFKLRHDPRITRVGAVLRKTSLDELPQLGNVLRGEMSLVGPRPLPSYHARELPNCVQRLRAEVLPGMTGLWQVSGRSDTGTAGMERWDSYYVRNWSLWLDFMILVRTVRVVLRGSGAY
ncbi:undecaprenyl-phosphate galactose phosphotransferase WbaP [Deinococcus peraridilitoris]|uniref:Undecaprenyl-phosphate galactose phosphotransferase, WbaP/exopolysaccharide biosynthesis polyprenyl glycosylphosphotransferase n=1 Tax=Deinococcus peraridilitoris (strain DSM 19664 / LMG 22246 / CIP 109416 / KR-200) TaxID=937777 RepID=L0A7V9_DEIPD|nr:undecaprenyl-phosphate galactose phosphotransferase WbaP [Deinococcus peraridilitoris]AFZ69524.1 Undecaprenyl-phosphate galactose phosphotransferase, WbaP/exopolysaccharide biosynthesis polyprenyl glycosylphosphotransferase [Deinococcus peraridilitoris DSM 19664]